MSDKLKSGEIFFTVITVCDETSAERCPVLPGIPTRLHWSFPDPSSFKGTHEEKLTRMREVRDRIEQKIQQWYDEVCATAVD